MAAQVVSEAVGWLVPAALAALLGLVGAMWRQVRAMREGMRSLLRCEIVRAHRAYCIRGEPMALDDLEYVAKTYGAYHDLGGNGTGTRLYDDIRHVAIRED